MRNAIRIFVLSLFTISNLSAQEACSIGLMVEELNKCKDNLSENLRWAVFGNFDFTKFAPAEGKINGVSYYEVGTNSKGQIKEIIYVIHKARNVAIKMIVSNAGNAKILRIKMLSGGDYGWTPLVIFLYPTGAHYLLNTLPIFKEDLQHFMGMTYSEWPHVNLKNISVIMQLSADLKVDAMIKLLNGRVVIRSYFDYKDDRVFETNRFYFESVEPTNSNVLTNQTCLTEFMFPPIPEFSLEVEPDMIGLTNAPLWIFGGVHDYKRPAKSKE
jgi:hypothetical protein